MAAKLIYHVEDGGVSPFDRCVIDIARNANVRIACPYLTLSYLRRLITVSSSWRLLTDIEEWFASLRTTERKSVRDFIAGHSAFICHIPELHAKVLIGDRTALVGSANFTISGIQRRTEMGIYLDKTAHVSELSKWFENLWETSNVISVGELDSLIKVLPEPPSIKRIERLVQSPIKRNATLVVLEQDRDIRR